MKIICWHSQLIAKVVDVINYLRNQNPHIIGLQDTHWINDSFKRFGVANVLLMETEPMLEV